MSTKNVPEKFWTWFDEVRGDLSIRQVEAIAKCPRSRIGNSYTFKRQPTPLVCSSIAVGLKLDEAEVLRQAGHLTSKGVEAGLKDAMAATISGVGGIGKSSLATEFLRQHSQDFPNKVFWRSFGTKDIETEDLETVLLLVKTLDKDKQKEVAKFISWQLVQQRIQLLIIDEIIHLDTDDHSGEVESSS